MKSYKLLLAFTLFLAFAFNMKAQYVHERSDQSASSEQIDHDSTIPATEYKPQ